MSNPHRKLLILVALVYLAVTPINALGQDGAAGALELRGPSPAVGNVRPELPPSGFSALCTTSWGYCVVHAKVPIAPGTLCHCAEYPGRTI